MKPFPTKKLPSAQEPVQKDAKTWPPPPVRSSQPVLDKDLLRERLGIAALFSAILSLGLPLVGIAILEVITKNLPPGSPMYGCFTMCQLTLFFGEIIAFVLGIISWNTKSGKSGVVISGSVVGLCLLAIVFSSFAARY